MSVNQSVASIYRKIPSSLFSYFHRVMESELFLSLKTLLVVSSIILILFCVLRVFDAVWWKPKSFEKQLKLQGIKGTPYKFLFGDIKEMKRSIDEATSKPIPLDHNILPRVLNFFHDLVQKFGNVCVCWVFNTPRVVVADPELMRLILTDKNGDIQKPKLNPLVDLLTLGLSTLEGEKWAKRRKLITPAFHLEKLQGMEPAFSSCCCTLVARLVKMVGNTPQGCCELDIAPELQRFSMDIISRTTFGSSYEEGKEILQLQTEQVELVLEAARSLYFPGLRFVPTKKNKRRYQIDRKIKSMLRDIINKKEEAIKRIGESGNKDLLGLMLQCNRLADDEMSTNDVIEECKLFYFAGQETTANLLTWTIILLSMHSDWQEKAREEVLRVCGKGIPGNEDINRLKIVSMILHEVLRLYPPVTAQFRQTKNKTNIGDMSIPAGVDLLLPTMLLHYDPKYWGEDAQVFKPERFSEGVSNASNGQLAFYPFGWGPRICLGQNFAMIESKMAIAVLLQHFAFQLSPAYTHAPRTVITLQPQHGAMIQLYQI